MIITRIRAGLSLLGVALGLAVMPAQAEVTLRFAHYSPESHAIHKAAVQFAAKVDERTKGQVKITLSPNNTLGSPPEILEQTKLGVVDMAIPTSGQMDKYDKAFAALMLPFVFDDLNHARRTMDGPLVQWLMPLAAKSNLVMIGTWEYGFRNLTNNLRPVNTPDDVKGMKVRTPPEIQLEAAMTALGGNVQKIAFPELYLALSQGTVDAEENPIAVIYSSKFFEVQKHLALTKHVYQPLFQVVNARCWAKLTPVQQTILREESAVAGKSMRAQLESEEQGLIEKMQAAGMKVTKPDLAPFRTAMAPAYKKIGDYAGEANVKAFLGYVETARKP